MNVTTFGVSRLSIVPVRSEPADRAEQVTQILFGDHYEVIEDARERTWLKIRVHADQYEGWIDAKQHHQVSQEHFEYLNRAELKITTEITSTILYNRNPLTIPMGSIIPIGSSELFPMEEQFAFNGEAKNAGQKREFDYLRQIAMKYLHAPYLWGGKTPFGIDCSGFTQMVFRICGFSLQRDAWQQASQGRPVVTLQAALPGDLAFFKNGEGRIVHVGIVFPDAKILHASGRVRIDRLTEEGIITDTKTLTHALSHLRRIYPESSPVIS
jgi:gamma-D-glutamyl-L-lysine dipeptidyl-peptidase